MEKLHKMVNGRKIYLTLEEETAVLMEWKTNKDNIEKERKKQKEKEEKTNIAMEKLYNAAGLTVEEKQLLKDKK